MTDDNRSEDGMSDESIESEDAEHRIPTPEELEQGAMQRRRKGSGEDDSGDGQEKKGGRFSFLRRRGVGRRRKYVKVDRPRETPAVEDPSSKAPAATRPARTVEETPPPVQRVKSVKLPARAPRTPEPKYGPYSKEGQFFQKAAEKGHRMGVLVPIPHTTNFEAVCERCQMSGELVVEIEDNYSNLTNHHFRGPAISRTCAPTTQ